jgi:hypothetical protein
VLLGALAAKRDATEEKYVAYRDRTDPPNHLLVPFVTRFNSPPRVRQARERFDSAWRTAAERFNRGVVLTLTTDPAQFDSLAAATGTLMDDVNRLKAWFANRFTRCFVNFHEFQQSRATRANRPFGWKRTGLIISLTEYQRPRAERPLLRFRR